MEFQFERVSLNKPQRTVLYANLFKTCFPLASHLSESYLEWLYSKNPDGDVVGFDAWHEGRLAAHYVCVPVNLKLFGFPRKALLSLNTATHPDYQGKGLFTKLADLTYCAGRDEGFDCVYGVANSNSTPGFLRKLSFALVGALDAKVGVRDFRLGNPTALADNDFRRVWSQESLAWRCSNPTNPIYLQRYGSLVRASASARKSLFGAEGVLDGSGLHIALSGAVPYYPLRTYVGLMPRSVQFDPTYFELPTKLRPSPLNLIFKPLAPDMGIPAYDRVHLTFLDFDAF